MDELRKKHKEINKASGGTSDFLAKFFMMDEGTSVVRILPGGDPEEQFYAETAIHRIEENGSWKNYHCPRVKGGDCPICDFYFRLWKTDSEANHNLARSIKARKRYYANVVDRRDGKVKILSVGMKLFGKILDCFFDEDYGDITDTEKGWDFKVVKDTIGQFPNYDKSSPKPKQTAAGTDSEIATWMDELHDIHGLVQLPTYDDMKKVVMNLAGDAPTTKDSTPSESNNSEDEDYLSHLKNIDS